MKETAKSGENKVIHQRKVREDESEIEIAYFQLSGEETLKRSDLGAAHRNRVSSLSSCSSIQYHSVSAVNAVEFMEFRGVSQSTEIQ